MKSSIIIYTICVALMSELCLGYPKIYHLGDKSSIDVEDSNRSNPPDSIGTNYNPDSPDLQSAIPPTPILDTINVKNHLQIEYSPIVKSEEFHSCLYSKHNTVEHSTLENTEADADYDGADYESPDDEPEVIPQLRNVSISGVGNVQIEICEPRAEYCYAIWKENPQDGQITILGQGCWVSSGSQKACNSDELCRSDLNRAHRHTKFCCCKASLCNRELQLKPPSSSTVLPIDSVFSSPPTMNKSIIPIIAVILVCSFLVLIFVIVICKYLKSEKYIKSNDNLSINNYESGGPGFSCSATCVDNLKLHDNIGSGRYSKVWSGSLGGVPVAVKALPASQSNLWAREKEVYLLPHMRHPNLLQYFGCDTRPTLDGPSEHLLVLQLAPLGSLKQYLIENTLDWDTYTNMALGIASAVAHLHTSMDKDGQYKPCVIHRDINSSNVLVRADLSCCLGDLGLAMPLPDSHTHPSQIQYRIQEAGTLRYLAPEALEGSLDLRRCAASLRAVDIYALALVLWELLSRCTTLYRPPGPPIYAPPFYLELGDHPTQEKMQVLITKRKARPLFSPRLLPFRATHLARDTCEDCWDHDAEARLTAVCVVERLTELKSMRPAISPTYNNNDLRPPSQNQDGTPNLHSPASFEDKNSNITSMSNGNVSSIIDFQANILHKLPLQPHQGRNPCLERNLACAEQDDALIDKSLKDMPSSTTSAVMNNRVDQSNLEYRSVSHDFSRPEEQNSSVHSRNTNRNIPLYSLYESDPENQPLNEYRQLVRPLTPIGYVQNDVSSDIHEILTNNLDSNPYGYPAKRSNIPQEIPQPKWGAKRLKMLFDSKMFKKKESQNKPMPLETQVNLVLSNGKPVNNGIINSSRFKTSVIVNDHKSKNNNVGSNELSGRPSSLPGLDSVVSNGTVSTDCSIGESIPSSSHRENNRNDIYNITPPNQTAPCNMQTKNDNCDKLVVGYKELPSNNELSTDSNKIYAVIVPKPSYNLHTDRSKSFLTHTGDATLLLTKPAEILKIENVLLTSDSDTNIKKKKRYSCDGNMLSNKHNNLQNRNSYSGEFEIESYSDYNKENDFDNSNMIDYSSNSEDEHMLLLAENGGSKITMRQRFDVKPNQDSKSTRKNRNSSASLSMNDNVFTENISKYNGKYENLNESEKLLCSSVKDGHFLNHRNKLSLSICKQDSDDTDLININHIEELNHKNDISSSDDDVSFPDDVFLKKSPNSFRPLSIKQNLSRQHSLELVSELFSSSADLTRLKDPASRIKTPGDVPPSVRKNRGSLGASKIRRTGSARDSTKKAANRLSLYDDRMMFGNSL